MRHLSKDSVISEFLVGYLAPYRKTHIMCKTLLFGYKCYILMAGYLNSLLSMVMKIKSRSEIQTVFRVVITDLVTRGNSSR